MSSIWVTWVTHSRLFLMKDIHDFARSWLGLVIFSTNEAQEFQRHFGLHGEQRLSGVKAFYMKMSLIFRRF